MSKSRRRSRMLNAPPKEPKRSKRSRKNRKGNRTIAAFHRQARGEE